MANSDRTELRVQIPNGDLDVLDGYCHAHGLDRSTVVRQVLREWSERQLHAATVICRIAGRNPAASESRRSGA